MEKVVKLNSVISGKIVQILIYGLSGDNYYRVGSHSPDTGKVVAYERFTQRRVYLHPFNLCRVVNH